MRRTFFSLFFFSFFLSLLSFSTAAASHLPKGLLVAQAANGELAVLVASNVTFFVAFIAGILTLLSPCILPLFPAFFSYTFKEKSKITKMTTLFFLGFAATFVTLGLIAAFIGGISLVILQQNMGLLIQIAGVLLIIFGVMAFFGKGFAGIVSHKKARHDPFGVFTFGIVFALGWSACVGPIVAGVLLMASIMGNYVTAATLMFAYALGVFVPLFIISFFYDRYDLSKLAIVRGKELTFRMFGKTFKTHSSNAISGVLFILLGLVFIIFKSTAAINIFDPLGTKMLFYEWQRWMLENPFLINFVGIVGIAILGWIIWEYAVKQWKSGERP